MKARSSLLALLAVLAFCPFAAVELPAQGPAKAEWTLLFYSDADCDLEECILDQLDVMVKESGSKDVHVVVLCDRSPLGDDSDGYTNRDVANVKNWSGAKLLHLHQGKAEVLGDWGDVNMGDAATLHKFMVTAARRFPAKKYALILNDHGTGWSGLCSDDSHKGAALTMTKLRTALQAGCRETGSLELIGFDCCLMATVEVASTVALFGRYMVASQELEPGDGWNMLPVFQAIKKKPAMNGAELGTIICDTYQEQFDKSEDETQRATGLGITLSLVDLRKVADLERAVAQVSDRSARLMSDERVKGWIKLARARSRTAEYGRGGNADEEAACFDLGDLAQRLRQQDPLAAVSCGAVDKALQVAVLHKVNGSALPYASGLTIFFPRKAEALGEDDDNKYEHLPFARNARWLALLTQYDAVSKNIEGLSELKPAQANRAKLQPAKGEKVVISSQLTGEDIDEVFFTLSARKDGKEIILGQVPVGVGANGRLSADWDGGWFVIGNGDHWVTCPITGTQEAGGKNNAIRAEVPAQVRRAGSKEWTDVTLHFYLARVKGKNEGKFIYAFIQGDHGARQMRLEKDDEVRPIYLELDGKGNETHKPSPNKRDIIKVGTGLAVGYRPLQAGSYYVGFGFVNLSGQRSDEEVEIDLQ